MQIVYIDLIPQKIKPVVKASQFDDKRHVRFRLTENGEDYTLTGTETVTVTVRKPDRNIVVITPNVTANNYIDVYFTEQACACFGVSFGGITIDDDNSKIGTCNFDLEVELSPAFGGIDSTSEIDNLNTQINAMVNTAVTEIAPEIIEEIAPGIIGDEYLTKEQIEEDYYNKTQVDTSLNVLNQGVQNEIYRLIPKARLYTLLAGETVLNITLSPGLGVTDIIEFKINEPNIAMPDITYQKDVDLNDHITLTFENSFDHNVTIMLIEEPYTII